MALEFRCRDVGVRCKASIRAESEEDLLERIARHARRKHGVPRLTETLVSYAKTKVRET